MTEPRSPQPLSYESDRPEPSTPRPRWVWAIVSIYGLMFAVILLFPLIVVLLDGEEVLTAASVVAAVLTLCGLGLIFTPVRAARRRPLTRRSVLIPIASAGLLVGTLFMGAMQAVGEWSLNESLMLGGLWGGLAIWILWTGILWHITRWRDPSSLAARLHQWVLDGSVAELLVAVPAHLVVRRREECCAGMLTGTAICVGVVVMFVAFGPSVALLYFKRWQKIQPPRREVQS